MRIYCCVTVEKSMQKCRITCHVETKIILSPEGYSIWSIPLMCLSGHITLMMLASTTENTTIDYVVDWDGYYLVSFLY